MKKTILYKLYSAFKGQKHPRGIPQTAFIPSLKLQVYALKYANSGPQNGKDKLGFPLPQ